MTDYLQVFITTETEAEAEKIASALVEEQLAGCVQVVRGVRSVYRWEGKVEQGEELLCLIKTSQTLLPTVKARICQLHSYDTPEIVAMPIVDGSQEYLSWLGEQLG